MAATESFLWLPWSRSWKPLVKTFTIKWRCFWQAGSLSELSSRNASGRRGVLQKELTLKRPLVRCVIMGPRSQLRDLASEAGLAIGGARKSVTVVASSWSLSPKVLEEFNRKHIGEAFVFESESESHFMTSGTFVLLLCGLLTDALRSGEASSSWITP